jgi:hypothetical protein
LTPNLQKRSQELQLHSALFCGEINNNYRVSPVMIRLGTHVTFSYPIIFRSTPLSTGLTKSLFFKMTDQTRLKATVYVGGLAFMVDEATLHAAFLPFGDIVDISLPKPEAPSSTELHRGFGYVEFEDPADAKEAIDNMDQAELFGRVIKVSAAKPQRNANEGLGSKTALWEQVHVNCLNILQLINSVKQEGWLAENAVSEEDRLAADRAMAGAQERPEDPMQGLEGLDVAGPKPA